MPVKGYANVRNLPSSKDKTYEQVFTEFSNGHSLCKKCSGRGFNLDDSKVDVLPGTTSVKIVQNELLKELDEKSSLNADAIRKIVETVVYDRKQCDKCSGFGFVKKARKLRDEKHSS